MERGAKKDKDQRGGELKRALVLFWPVGLIEGASNCVTGSADRFSTWLQRHHVVVTLGDAAHSGGASQAQARLANPAALALHPCIKRSVEPNRKIKQTLFV